MYTRLRALLVAVFAALLLPSLAWVPPAAGAPAADGPLVGETNGGVRVQWGGALPALRALDAGAPAAPLVTIGGVQVPAQLIALRITGTAPAELRIGRAAGVPWRGAVLPAQHYVPQTADGVPRPDLAVVQTPTLPATPAVVLREGWLRGTHIAVLALSSVYAAAGVPRAVTALDVTIPGAALLRGDAATLLAADGPFLAAAPAPSNPLAGKGWRIQVTQAGMQTLSAAALSAAGVSLANPALLHLRHNGAEIALQQIGSGAGLELRFFAPAPGDRWNAGDTYWLSPESTAGTRMGSRSAQAGAAPLSGYVWMNGVWRNNQLYDSTLPGPDADHWFADDLKTGPGLPAAALTANLAPSLPIASGTATLTIAGSSYLSTTRTLQLTVGSSTGSASWKGLGNWSHTLSLPVAPATAASALVKLPSGSAPDGNELDSIAWRFPASLNVNGRGAMFSGVDGTWRYQIANVAAGAALYDVTNPAAPIVLTNAIPVFQDGLAAHAYVLAGAGTLFAPAISRSAAADLTTPGKLVYIAPAALQSALAPLVARRQAQGYSVRVLDVQAIYDAWSFGQVAPGAIRDFLRYAAAHWSTPPAAVTLVGDGTSDPLDYTKHGDVTFIPPYLANVDPWLGETACEPCYARLDGDDPTLDPLADLMLGRLPVKSADELATVVGKIIAYETGPLDLSWRSRSLYVADNFRDAQNNTDGAGDFAAFADASAAQQPVNLQIRRMYYDPSVFAIGVPWRERDPMQAYRRTVAAVSEGNGLVNYIGHGSQFQWATTELDKTPPYLFGRNDAADLNNGARLPIVLEMTCLTGAFQTPTFGGTLDETMLINPNGGAVAVWGPTGLGVAHGHDMLQDGFYDGLWAAPPLKAQVGQLTGAGSLKLFTQGSCCQDTLATYALLGDPVMPARVMPAQRLYLPMARR
jgi:hypothetical protein